MNRVLLVDDDALLTELLTEYLSAEGLEVSSVPDGEAGVNEILNGNYNVVVLDSMMPKLSGLDVLKTVRQQSKTPIIMLTAKGDDIDRIIGLEMGADDYVPKPCQPRELLARINAILRRTRLAEPDNNTPNVISVSDVTLYPAPSHHQRSPAGAHQHRIQPAGSADAPCRPGGEQRNPLARSARPQAG